MRALLSTLSAIVALLVGYTNVPSLVYRWNEGLLGPATMWVIVTVSAVNAVLATLVCVTLVVMVSRRAQLAAVMLLMLPYRDTRAARPRPMAATSALGCCVGAAAAVVYGVPGKDGTGSLIPGS